MNQPDVGVQKQDVEVGKREVAIAILYQDRKFLMQLRDNIPTIYYPGQWGLFGGHIEPGETPDIAVIREVHEEIGYTLPPTVTKFGCYNGQGAIRHVFHAPLTLELNQLLLNEGWDMGFLTADNIRLGRCYSAAAKEERPLGLIHQRIMLDFLEQHHDLLS